MASSCCNFSSRILNPYITRSVYFLLLLLDNANSLYFQVPRFDSGAEDILYVGDAVPSFGTVNFNSVVYCCRVGQVLYKERVPLWEPNSGKLSDFVTHFSFIIDTQGAFPYGHGLAFFLAPVGFTSPLNSVAGFLGLFNSTNSDDSSQNPMVFVEFDSFSNREWDPPVEHVGINKNSVSSVNYAAWNASLYSEETANAWISYNSTTKNLSVFWTYERNPIFQGNSTLSYQIDLKEALPSWVTIGFSASTGQYMERHILQYWEFNSSLDIKLQKSEDPSKKVKLAVGLSVPFGVILAGGIVTYVIWSKRRSISTQERLGTTNLSSINDDLERGAGPKRYSYIDLALATNNFSDDQKLGEGGFGCVYKGYLTREGVAVAVKKISKGSKQGKEYITEVKIISRLRHRNLVQLIGWCHDENQFLLVYEFMSKGSLDSHLFDKKAPLVWTVRYKISFGLAFALLYLHEEWEQCVVHRDIKSSNIMLDSGFNVKLGDFGLARLMDHELAPPTTGIAGTLGYMAPEYLKTGKASKESDVFSFGVVALEIVCGRRSNDCIDENFEMGLVEWVWYLHGRGEIVLAVDGRLNKDFDAAQAECLMMVGLWRAHPDRSLRPTIRQAIQVLNFEASVPNLPTSMPVLRYHVPNTPASSSGDALLTSSSINIGR